MRSHSSITLEQALYLAILALALTVRLLSLGAAPLTEAEAQQAWPAYQIAQGDSTALGDQPAYVLFTSALFSLLGSSNFLARFWPALFGSSLVLLPYIWRQAIGRVPALLLAAALALDPGLLAFSRAAQGLMLGLAAALWALAAWRAGRNTLAGVLAVVAAYSSAHIYVGLLASGLAWLVVRQRASDEELDQLRGLAANPNPDRKAFLIGAGLSVGLGATLLLRLPEGIGGLAGPLAAFIRNLAGGGVPLSYLLLAVLAYGLLPLVFGRSSSLASWRQAPVLIRFLTWFAIAALALTLINPGREVADLIWLLLPLWVLAAQRLTAYLRLPEEEPLAAAGQAFLILLLGMFLILNLAKLSQPGLSVQEYNLRLLTVGAVVVLGGLASLMIGLGWSRQAATQGLVWGFAALLLLGMLSASWRLAARPVNAANDLWLPVPAAGQADLLHEQLAEIAGMRLGDTNQLAVEQRSAFVSLQWALRHFASANADETAPDLILIDNTAAEPATMPMAEVAYRGQTLVWQRAPAWGSPWPPNIVAWWLYRQAPTQAVDILLWARTDLFPGDTTDTQTP